MIWVVYGEMKHIHKALKKKKKKKKKERGLFALF